MYEVKRQQKIREELKLGDEILVIEIAPLDIVQEYQQAATQLILAREAVKAAKATGVTEKEVQALGEAIVTLLVVLIGKENTDKLVAFYEENYIELLLMIFPFIQEVIQPQMNSMIAQMREQAHTAYSKGKQGKSWAKSGKLFRAR